MNVAYISGRLLYFEKKGDNWYGIIKSGKDLKVNFILPTKYMEENKIDPKTKEAYIQVGDITMIKGNLKKRNSPRNRELEEQGYEINEFVIMTYGIERLAKSQDRVLREFKKLGII